MSALLFAYWAVLFLVATVRCSLTAHRYSLAYRIAKEPAKVHLPVEVKPGWLPAEEFQRQFQVHPDVAVEAVRQELEQALAWFLLVFLAGGPAWFGCVALWWSQGRGDAPDVRVAIAFALPTLWSMWHAWRQRHRAA